MKQEVVEFIILVHVLVTVTGYKLKQINSVIFQGHKNPV